MAVNKIRVNTNSLNHTRSELQAKLDKIKNDIKNISGNMATLNSMWEGEAHQAFAQQVDSDISFLTGACDRIQKIINFESTAVTEYDKCERQISDLISQIRI